MLPAGEGCDVDSLLFGLGVEECQYVTLHPAVPFSHLRQAGAVASLVAATRKVSGSLDDWKDGHECSGSKPPSSTPGPSQKTA